MLKLIDLIGKRFGRLEVLEQTDEYKWLCRCDCGTERIVLEYHLKSGHTKSCGCLQKEKIIERSTKHGYRNDEIYYIWLAVKQRCTNLNCKDYKDYGGRGITVCDEWINSPENFIKDMKKNWKPGLTLERKRNWEGYYPDNCEWVTQKENNRNKRNNLYVPYKGKNRLLVELCEEHNMPYGIVYDRIYKYGWSPEKALTTPIRKWRKHE